MIAITHVPSPAIQHCQLTYVARAPIDFERAVRQHQQYCEMLASQGVQVQQLAIHSHLPDCVFVEDTAIVLDELAILASMGTASRREELAGIEAQLRRHREVVRIELPAEIEGGDVLRIGRTLLVGLSTRTNAAGAAALETLVRPFGYRVVPVPVRGCLHLKTACTALSDRLLLVNPEWIDCGRVRGFELLTVHPGEPWAANVVRLGTRRWIASDQPRTASLIRQAGFDVDEIEISEFAKAEGGVSCLSLLVDDANAGSEA